MSLKFSKINQIESTLVKLISFYSKLTNNPEEYGNNNEYSFTLELPGLNDDNVGMVVRTSSSDLLIRGLAHSNYYVVLKLPNINKSYANMELKIMVVDTIKDYALDYVHSYKKKLVYAS